MAGSKDDQFSDKEAKARFEAALRGGLSTPPKPLKSMTPKGSKKQPAVKKGNRKN
jgi:hypothetical protein